MEIDKGVGPILFHTHFCILTGCLDLRNLLNFIAQRESSDSARRDL